jgi:hypothetical protein
VTNLTTLKLDDNLRPIPDSYGRIPLSAEADVDIDAEGGGTATINIPSGERWFIKKITVTEGSDVTTTEIAFDGNDIGVLSTVADTVATYGTVITAEQTITIAGDNAHEDTARNLKIEVFGYKII